MLALYGIGKRYRENALRLNFVQTNFRKFEPFVKIAKISPREIFPPYGIQVVSTKYNTYYEVC